MQYRDDQGQPVLLDPKVGSGGEANIHAVNGRPDLVAKMYFQPTLARSEKLRAMVASPPKDPCAAQGHVSICWPKRLVFESRRSDSVGFLMQRVDYSTNRPVLLLYNPMDRRRVAPGFTWGYLLRTAANIASVVDAIHDCGYVIGDLNESNFLVSDRALVTLVDCDSMQVLNARGGVFRCTVGKPEFTAPELQGVDFSQVDREKAQDNFALGVMIFYLLMEGVHPYAGVWQGGGSDPPLEQRIRHGESPYVTGTNVAPMPFAVPFDFLPDPLKTLFIRCFGYGHNSPAIRPSAHDWYQALNQAEKGLAQCATHRRHIYPKHNKTCPWCNRKKLLKGHDPFPGPKQQPLRAKRFSPTLAPTVPSAPPIPVPVLPSPTLTTPGPTATILNPILAPPPPVAVAARITLLPGAAPTRKVRRVGVGILLLLGLSAAISYGWPWVQSWFDVNPPVAKNTPNPGRPANPSNPDNGPLPNGGSSLPPPDVPPLPPPDKPPDGGTAVLPPDRPPPSPPDDSKIKDWKDGDHDEPPAPNTGNSLPGPGTPREEPPPRFPNPVPPTRPPVLVSLPLFPGQNWRGTYRCPQGDTAFMVRITQVSPPDPTGQSQVGGALYFTHRTGATGIYNLAGLYDSHTNAVALRPAGWLQQPPGAIPVGLVGHVEDNGSRMAGRLDYPTCYGFDLHETSTTVSMAFPNLTPPAPPPRPQNTNTIVSGVVQSYDAGGWPIVAGRAIHLHGVTGIASTQRFNFGAWLAGHGGSITCQPVGDGTYSCVTRQNLDVAQAILMNGAASASLDAPPGYISLMRQAQLSRRGQWQ